jgi:hypothetical protein
MSEPRFTGFKDLPDCLGIVVGYCHARIIENPFYEMAGHEWVVENTITKYLFAKCHAS